MVLLWQHATTPFWNFHFQRLIGNKERNLCQESLINRKQELLLFTLYSRTNNCLTLPNKLLFKCQTIKPSVVTPDRDTWLHVSPAWTKPIAFVIIHFHGMACHKIDEIHFARGAANHPVSLMRGFKPHLLSELCTLLFYWQYFPFGRQTHCVCPELSTPAAHLPSDHLSAPGFCFSSRQRIKVLPHHL